MPSAPTLPSRDVACPAESRRLPLRARAKSRPASFACPPKPARLPLRGRCCCSATRLPALHILCAAWQQGLRPVFASPVPSRGASRGAVGISWARGIARTRVLEARLRVVRQPGPYAWPYASLCRPGAGPGLGRRVAAMVAARGVRPLRLGEHVVSLPDLNHF